MCAQRVGGKLAGGKIPAALLEAQAEWSSRSTIRRARLFGIRFVNIFRGGVGVRGGCVSQEWLCNGFWARLSCILLPAVVGGMML